MDVSSNFPKDPRYVAAGKKAMRARWDADAIARGLPPGRRRVRLDELDLETRRRIEAILDEREARLLADVDTK